eukprot:16172252-Heterocapsa_arctica.AAC.1
MTATWTTWWTTRTHRRMSTPTTSWGTSLIYTFLSAWTLPPRTTARRLLKLILPMLRSSSRT